MSVKSLACAVIDRALRDITYRECCQRTRIVTQTRNRKDARDWFIQPAYEPEVQYWCHLAGMDERSIVAKARMKIRGSA